MNLGLDPKDYLNQLLQDKTNVSQMPKIFLHLERLLDEEISRVRNEIFSPSNFLMSLAKPSGHMVKLTEKVYANVKEYPKFNFVGRIIGPRGLTLRQVEEESGTKLLVRGRGSMKDRKTEQAKRGQPNHEHLEDDLHVLILVEDTEERARQKLTKAVEEVTRLFTPPSAEGEDDLKKKQLQDLAILNGTYRPPGATDAPPVQALQPPVQYPPPNGRVQYPPPNGMYNGIPHNPPMMPYCGYPPLPPPYPPNFPPMTNSTGPIKAHIARMRSMYKSHPYNGYNNNNNHNNNNNNYSSYYSEVNYSTRFQGSRPGQSTEITNDHMVIESESENN